MGRLVIARMWRFDSMHPTVWPCTLRTPIHSPGEPPFAVNCLRPITSILRCSTCWVSGWPYSPTPHSLQDTRRFRLTQGPCRAAYTLSSFAQGLMGGHGKSRWSGSGKEFRQTQMLRGPRRAKQQRLPCPHANRSSFFPRLVTYAPALYVPTSQGLPLV